MPRSAGSTCAVATGKAAISTVCIANSHKPQLGLSGTNMVSQGKASNYPDEHFLGPDFWHFVDTYAVERERKGTPPALLH